MGLDKEIKEINTDLDKLDEINTDLNNLSDIKVQNEQIISLLTSIATILGVE